MKRKEPSKTALRLARDMAVAFDALQSDWTAVVVVLRKADTVLPSSSSSSRDTRTRKAVKP